MAEISIEQVTKVYPQGVRAVDGIDLQIPDGSLTVLVGPSGCGKTTLLRMIAGLEDISSGTIKIGDRVVNRVSPKDRDIAMVFQNYALYPHMNVTQNLAFGLRQRKLNRSEIGHRVQDVARRLALGGMLNRKPGELSGGQQQRVAMGRAIVRNPQAFLMDEPLSNLDAKLRVQLRTEISRLQRDLGATMIYVTHDQVEAMTMGDQVAVMRSGVLQQVGKPFELYTRPANLFVAGFIGSPAMNLIEAIIEQHDDSLYARFGRYALCVDGYPPRKELLQYVGSRVALGIRPEVLADALLSREAPEKQTLRVKVELLEALGSEVLVHFGVEAPPVLTDQTIALALDADEDIGNELERDAAAGSARLVAKLDARSRAAEGEPVDLVVDTERLQFFDLTTGRTLADTTDRVCQPT